ncbi:MAG: hypothetical protein WAZ27_01495 [Minisyncoccia bacterium]
MKKLILLACASLFVSASASAQSESQAGLICNTPEAASAAAYFRFIGNDNTSEQLAWVVSSENDWCIPGIVRSTRPNTVHSGLEKIQTAIDDERAHLQLAGDLIGMLPLDVGPVGVVGTLIKMLPATEIELRKFKRENGRSGYYILERILDR